MTNPRKLAEDLLRASEAAPKWETIRVNGVDVRRLIDAEGGDEAFTAFTQTCISLGPPLARALLAAMDVVEAARWLGPCGAQRHGEAGCAKCEVDAALNEFDALVSAKGGSDV